MENDDAIFREALIKIMAWNDVPTPRMAELAGVSEEAIAAVVDRLREGWEDGTVASPVSTVELFLGELEKDLARKTGPAAERDLRPANAELMSDVVQVANNALAERGVEREVIVYVSRGLMSVFKVWRNHIERVLAESDGWEEAA